MQSLFKRQKKGEAPSGAAAAALVALIAAAIILYILALPPEERSKLLDDNSYDSDGSTTKDEILLSESPGRLLPQRTDEFEKEFSPVSVYIGEESVELKRKDSLYIRRSLFNSKVQSITFDVNDPEDIKDALLGFEILKGNGRLIISLNEQEIFNRDIESSSIEPINLKKSGILKKGINEIEFEVSSPSVVFWTTHEYELKNIIVTATSFERNTQESSLSFVVTEGEKQDIETLRLWFNTECKQTEVGSLEISINNYNLFSGVPDCGQANKPIEFLPNKFVAGENKLSFKTQKGRYLIDHLRMTSNVRESKPKTYYFEVEEDELREIKNRSANVTLYLRFEDEYSDKEAEIRVNNHLIDLDQTDIEFETSIRNFVEEGTNAIKIVPDEILDISELKIEYKE